MDFDFAFPALVAGRLLLAFAPLPDTLKHDQLLSSPLTSYPRCAVLLLTHSFRDLPVFHGVVQEGIYLFQHDVDPYSGGLFRQVCVVAMLSRTVVLIASI